MWTKAKVINELNKLCMKDGIGIVNVPVEINGRLTRTLGRVKFMDYGEGHCHPTKIEFSKQLLDFSDDDSIINVIKHEYVHYYLLVETGTNHGHNAIFKKKCAEIGCAHDQTQNEINTTAKSKYEIWCPDCNKMIATRARKCKLVTYPENYRCGECKNNNLKVIQNW